MDYTLDEALHPGHPFPEGESYAVELDVLDLSEEGGEEAQEEKAPRDFLEARFTGPAGPDAAGQRLSNYGPGRRNAESRSRGIW